MFRLDDHSSRNDVLNHLYCPLSDVQSVYATGHSNFKQKYGLFIADKGISGRANVLINADQTIEWIREYKILQVPDIEEVIKIVSG